MAYGEAELLSVPEDLPEVHSDSREELEFFIEIAGLKEGNPLFARRCPRLRDNMLLPSGQVRIILAALNKPLSLVLRQLAASRDGTPGATASHQPPREESRPPLDSGVDSGEHSPSPISRRYSSLTPEPRTLLT
jgi:hypothetical protein